MEKTRDRLDGFEEQYADKKVYYAFDELTGLVEKGLKQASEIPVTTDKLSVEKLQEHLNTAKKALTGAIKDIEQFHEFAEKSLSKNYPLAFKSDSRFDYTRSAFNVLTDALAAIGGDDE